MSNHLAGPMSPVLRRIVAFRGDIYRFLADACRKRANANDCADELAQETLTRGVESARTFASTEDEVKPWLFGIAGNVLATNARRAARELPMPLDVECTASAQPRPEDVANARRLLARVHEALATMPPRSQQVVVLVGIQGLSFAQAGALLGLTEDATKKLLKRARETLLKRSNLQREDVRAVVPFLFREEQHERGPLIGIGPRSALLVASAAAFLLVCSFKVHQSTKPTQPTLALSLSSLNLSGITVEPLEAPQQAPIIATPEPAQVAAKPALPRASRAYREKTQQAQPVSTAALDIALKDMDRTPIHNQ